MPVLRGLTELEAQALGLPAGSCEITSAGAKTATSYSPGRWRGAKTYLLPPDPNNPGQLRHQMHVGRDVHYEDDGGNWRTIDLNWSADPANPGEFVTDRNDVHTRVTRFGVAVWDRKRRVGVRWSTTVRPTTGGRRASFPKDGLTWAWSATTSGLKLESEPVATLRGPQTYEWRYLVIDLNRTDGFNLFGTLSVDAGGNLVGDGFVTPRAYAIGANSVRYDCGPWQVVGGKTRAVSFAFDDSALPPEAFPYVIDPSTTFNVAASGDDGYLRAVGATYATLAATVVDTAFQNIILRRQLSAGTFTVEVAPLRLDTSVLPDAASVTGAVLRIHVNGKFDADARNITADWYPAANWPIDAADWTLTAGNDAITGADITALVLNADNDFTLTGAAANVNLTGYTAIRMYVDGGQPVGQNGITFAAFDHATLAEPRLIIDYTDGAGSTPVPLDLGTATIAGVSSVTATLSTQTGTVAVNLGPVTIAGTSTVTASVVVKVPLSAAIAAASSLSASPIVRVGLSAAILATSSLAATLSTVGMVTPVALAATIAGTSGMTATLAARVALQAAITGASSITATLSAVGTLNPVALSAAISATSGLTAGLGVRQPMTAQISITSTITANVASKLGLTASIAGASAITATPVVRRALSAVIAAQSGITATLTTGTITPVALSATIAATSGLAATLQIFTLGDAQRYVTRVTPLGTRVSIEEVPSRVKIAELRTKWEVTAVPLYTDPAVGEIRELSIQLSPGLPGVTLPTSGVVATWRFMLGTSALSNGGAVVAYDTVARAIIVTAVVSLSASGLCRLEYTVSGLGNETRKPALELVVNP